MGYLIDTNILSELQKAQRCHPNVQNWYNSVNAEQLFLSVLVIGEIRQGIGRLRHRDAVQANVIEQRLVTVKRMMQKRILPITQAVAERFGYLNSPCHCPLLMDY
jgi:toxin FitB